MKAQTFVTRLLILACVLVSGCTVSSFSRIGPETNFAYPNSNIKALGPVEAGFTGSVTFLSLPDIRTSESDRRLMEEALQKSEGANLIADYVVTSTIKSFILFYWVNHEIEGVAARMDVGSQVLK